MSLKHVHLAFVATAMLLILFCVFRAVTELRVSGSWTLGIATLGALAAFGLLVRYQQRFLRSCREAGIR